jgi:hypothetical protein
MVIRACNEDIRGRIKGAMMIRRIFAGSIIGLLVFVTPLAVACDLSCAFSFMESDCHAAQTGSLAMASTGMNMDGMSMPGMDMREVPGEMGQSSDSSVSPGHAAHPFIGDMGPCEKQACDTSAVAAKGWRSGDSHFQVLLVASGTHRAEAAPALFRVARDEVTNRFGYYESSLRLNLRI